MIANIGDSVYIVSEEGELFIFRKETGIAEIACQKSGCGHNIGQTRERNIWETHEHNIDIGNDCEANLCVVDANFNGIQYYKGDLYYVLSTNMASILYKMSANAKTKEYYASLVGESGFGGSAWLLHRGYIYFSSDDDGFYRMPIDNPKQKEKLIDLSVSRIEAEGSYIYFEISGNIARYNIESGQIEQFTDISNKYVYNFLVNNGKIYFNEGSTYGTVYSYDTGTGEKETFLPEKAGGQMTSYSITSADSDYIYVEENVYNAIDSIYSADKRTCVYTWEGAFVGAITSFSDKNGYTRELRPFAKFHNETSIWIGNDDDRIYFIKDENDVQCDEDGIIEEYLEGTGKKTISYINKSELSADGVIPEKHTACEIGYDKDK